MKHSFKKIMASLLVAVMILSVSPVDAISEIDFSSLFSVKATALTSGKFTYELSGTNATITGYSGTDTDLTIPSKLDGNTVVAIAHNVFTNNSYLTKVTIPSTVTSIGYSTTYYDGTFQGCKKLKTVIFEEGSADAVIGPETFMGCAALQSVTIPGNYTTVRQDAFKGCISLNSVTLKKSSSATPNQVLEQGAFTDCSSLANISLPTTLKHIGPWAFAGCAATSVSIPEGVTNIEHCAFLNCNYLTNVSLPSTLTNIGYSTTYYDGTFQGCKKLKTVTLAEGTQDAVIGPETFMGCAALQSVTIPGNYTTIRQDAFKGCSALQSVTLKQSDYSYANQVIEQGAFTDCSSLANISLPTTLKHIGPWAFAGCAATSVSIPEGVTNIEHCAFLNCNYLTNVSLPSTLTNIGYSTTYYDGAFQGCKKLKTVTFAEGTQDAVIGPETFMGCAALQSVAIPGNYTTIRQDAFKGCSALQSVTLKQSDYSYANQVIEQGAFTDCSSLANISLPTTLKHIGPWAFAGCAATSVSIPEGVTTIEHSAFLNCPNLVSVSLPSTLTSMGYSTTYYDGVFQGCSKLQTVIFAEGTKDLTIGPETFKNCSSLTTVHLPLNLVSIKEEAFSGSTANLTICSISNSSYGKTYANSNSIKFKLCGGHNIIKIGDVNNDGKINSSDALLVLKHAVGSDILTGNAFTAADTNKDKQLNSSDALKILQFSVGKIKEF